MANLASIRKPVVIVVEDEPEAAELLSMMLHDAGCDPIVVRDGASALEAARELPAPDLVLVDLELPIMNGRELIETMRSDPTLSGIPVVVVSGAPDAGTVHATDNVRKSRLKEGLVRVLERFRPAPLHVPA